MTTTINDVHTPKSTGIVTIIAVTAALGGLLFGYDTGVIGVALLGLEKQFLLNESTMQLVTGAIILGALFGCLCTGPLSDRLGRRKMVIAVGVLFAAGSIASAFAPSITFLIIARFVLGLSAGSSTQIIPVYIAEVAPPQHRGKMVVLFQFMVVFGITVAYFSGFILNHHWRWAFGLGVIPAMILLAGMILLPESPRWLVIKHQNEKAMTILQKLRGNQKLAQIEIEEIKTVAHQPQGSWRDLTKSWIRPAVVVGVAIAMFSQITGNNALIYYAPVILTHAGFSTNVAILGTGASTVLVVIMTVTGSFLVDKIGRRRYLLWTIPGSIIALIIMGYLFQGNGPQTAFSQTLVVICLAAYLMLNCGGFGVCIWLINSEVYPLFVRGKGASLGAFSHWFFDLIVTLTTLSLVTALGATYTFWLYAFISIIALLFIIYLVPETKGKTLEEIEEDLKSHRFYAYQNKNIRNISHQT